MCARDRGKRHSLRSRYPQDGMGRMHAFAATPLSKPDRTCLLGGGLGRGLGLELLRAPRLEERCHLHHVAVLRLPAYVRWCTTCAQRVI